MVHIPQAVHRLTRLISPKFAVLLIVHLLLLAGVLLWPTPRTVANTILTPADTCAAATLEVATLPFGPVSDTTVGMTDDYDLPPDTTNPTCTAPTNGTGGGPAGSLPRGAIYTGTGTGPDRAYKFKTDVNCTLNITMDPTSTQDLSLIVYEAQCSSLLSDCVVVDDTGVGGVAESVSIDAIAGTEYFVVVDGYSTGGTPPGPSGPFDLTIAETTATGCQLVGDGPVPPDMELTKSDGGATTNPGGVVAYTLGYANSSSQQATGVVITETVPANTVFNAGASSGGWVCNSGGGAGDTCTIPVGAVAGGANGLVTFAVTVNATVPAGVTEISNTAAIGDDGANGTDPTPGNNTASDTTPVNANPDMQISKDDGGLAAAPGDVVVYTLSYNNGGNQDATGVVITEVVPDSTTFNAGSSTGGWACNSGGGAGDTCTLAIGGVAVGANSTSTFAVTVDSSIPAGVETVINTATIADDGNNGADPNPSDNSDTDATAIAAFPDMQMTKDDGGATAVSGEPITYTLAYGNVGNQDATGVVITETVPVSTTFDASGSTAGWSCADGSAAGTECILTIGNLAASGNGTAQFVVVVDLTATSGTIVNTAVMANDGTGGGDPSPSDNTATESTSFDVMPDLQLTKSDGGITVAPGDSITYTLSYANNGNEDGTWVIITETVPVSTTFDASASTPGWSCADGSAAGTECTLAVGSVAVGNNGAALFVVVVDQSAGNGTVVNTAVIADDASNDIDPTPSDNTATETTPVQFIPLPQYFIYLPVLLKQ